MPSTESHEGRTSTIPHLEPTEAASSVVWDVMAKLGTHSGGLTSQQAQLRLKALGPNVVRSHQARPSLVLLRQLRSPLLVLLTLTAAISFFLGERADAVIIAVILTASIGLGFFNEYRAERTGQALHEQIRHRALVLRDGRVQEIDVTEVVPGDVVTLRMGEVVSADVRLFAVTGLECDESVLTGESVPSKKTARPVPSGSELAELSSCALMGTVVHAGYGRGVVVATGGATQFGRIALGLGKRQPETEFQIGLRRFSLLLIRVAGVLTALIFLVNVLLDRPVIDALLFSLAIAVGISPQLLPAVVSTSLATGSRQLARRKVLVKRLVCIEDLGDVEVLFTDKTGTLTEGRTSFMHALTPEGEVCDGILPMGLACNDATLENGRLVHASPLDSALWGGPVPPAQREASESYRRLALVPFDHERRMVSVLLEERSNSRMVVTKGAPESVLVRCAVVPDGARMTLEAEFAAGHRVVALATRSVPTEQSTLTADDEKDLRLQGFLVFLDPPKASAGEAIKRLAELGTTVKVVTGDNPAVAERVSTELDLPPGHTLTGTDLDALNDEQLADLIPATTVFARMGPEQKSRIVRVQRGGDVDVAFLGDGVNDALALHAADVGVSVESGTDVAKEAADVILLEKDLLVLADGVVEGRRIFANTMKYVLMGTSSNFGNMFSAAGASAFLGFLPMLPSQILLNNLLYDSSQLAIPTDHVDAEQLSRPSQWNIVLIRRFMLFFGPISSMFDFMTFAVLLWVFHTGPDQFRSGWFMASLATQILVVFVIRTRRIPFLQSRPSVLLSVTAFGVVTVGVALPATPLAPLLGFTPMPFSFLFFLSLMVICYLLLIEVAKRWFFQTSAPRAPQKRGHHLGHRMHRRAGRFSAAKLPKISAKQ